MTKSLAGLARDLEPFLIPIINKVTTSRSSGGTSSLPPSEYINATFVTVTNNSNLDYERALTAGDGIDLTDAGANSTITVAVDVTDIIGTGLTETSNNIILNFSGTPNTIEVGDTPVAGTSSYAAHTDHEHGITTSSNPGANAIILASNTSGYLELERLGVGTAPSYTLHALSTAEQLRLAYDVSNYSQFIVDGSGNLEIDPTGNLAINSAGTSAMLNVRHTSEQLRLEYDASNYSSFTITSGGNIQIEPIGNIMFETGSSSNQIDPITNYKENLGQLSKKYLTLHAAELWVETLVAQNTIATIGGRILVGPTTKFAEDTTDQVYTISPTVANGGFETAGTGGADVFDSWTEYASDGTITRSVETPVRSGTYHCRLIAGASVDTRVYQLVSCSPGDIWIGRFWSRGYAGNVSRGRYAVWDQTNSAWIVAISNMNSVANDTTYVDTVFAFVVPAGCTQFSLMFYCPATNGDRVYIDDVVLTEGSTITVEHNQMSVGDIVYSEAYDVNSTPMAKVEFMRVITSYTVNGDYYDYRVLRDLDETGQNSWYAGDALFNTGGVGDGFMDLYSYSGVTSGTVGPTIAGNVRNSLIYYDWSTHWAIGNMNGLYGYGSNDIYGAAFGEYVSGQPWISVDSTNGFRINRYTTVLGQWQTDGDIFIGSDISAAASTYLSIFATGQTYNSETMSAGDMLIGNNSASKANILWDYSAGQLLFRGGTTTQVYIDTTGAITAGGGKVKLDSGGIQITSGTGYDTATEIVWDSSGDVMEIDAWRGSSQNSGKLTVTGRSGETADMLVSAHCASSQTATLDLYADNSLDVSEVQLTVNGSGAAYILLNADYVYANGYLYTEGGLHVGGSTDPGTDNLIVDGTSTFSNHLNLTSSSEQQIKWSFGSSYVGFYRNNTSSRLGAYDWDNSRAIWYYDAGTNQFVMSRETVFADASIFQSFIDLDSSELTISGGAVTVTKSYHTIDTEGDVATDNLDTINAGTAGYGTIIILRSADSSRDVTIRDASVGGGNIQTAGSVEFTLDHVYDVIAFMWVGNWIELFRANNV